MSERLQLESMMDITAPSQCSITRHAWPPGADAMLTMKVGLGAACSWLHAICGVTS